MDTKDTNAQVRKAIRFFAHREGADKARPGHFLMALLSVLPRDTATASLLPHAEENAKNIVCGLPAVAGDPFPKIDADKELTSIFRHEAAMLFAGRASIEETIGHLLSAENRSSSIDRLLSDPASMWPKKARPQDESRLFLKDLVRFHASCYSFGFDHLAPDNNGITKWLQTDQDCFRKEQARFLDGLRELRDEIDMSLLYPASVFGRVDAELGRYESLLLELAVLGEMGLIGDIGPVTLRAAAFSLGGRPDLIHRNTQLITKSAERLFEAGYIFAGGGGCPEHPGETIIPSSDVLEEFLDFACQYEPLD